MTNENKLENLVDSIWDKTSEALDQAFRKASEFAAEVDAKVAEQEAQKASRSEQAERVKEAVDGFLKNFRTPGPAGPVGPKGDSVSKDEFDSIINKAFGDRGQTIRPNGDIFPTDGPTADVRTETAPRPAPRRDPFGIVSDLDKNKRVIEQAIIEGEAIEFRYLKIGSYQSEHRTLDVSELDTAAGLVKGTDPDDGDQFKSFRLTQIQGLVRIV